MTIVPPTIPTRGYPGMIGPYSNVTPLTHRDAATLQNRMEDLYQWIETELVPGLDGNVSKLVTDLNAQYVVLREAMVKYQEEDEADRAEFEAIVQEASEQIAKAEQWAASTQLLQDTAVSSLIGDTTSLARQALDKRYAVTLASPGRTVDVVPILQALYDTGVRHVTMIASDVYFWNSTLFADSASVRDVLIINNNMAVWSVGPLAGKSVTPYPAGTPGTRFLIIGNLKRTNSATVSATNGNCPTGFDATVGPRVVVNDLDVRGNMEGSAGELVQVAYGHNTSVKLNHGRVSYINGFQDSSGYSDSNQPNDVRLTNPFGDASTVIRQQGNGDALVVAANADARSYIADLRYNRGSHFLAPVGGSLRFVDCQDVVITGGHIEGDEGLRNTAPLRVTRSLVSVIGTEFWTPNDNKTFHAIEVVDGSANPNAATSLLLEEVTVKSVYRGNLTDERANADLFIGSLNPGSTIRARGFHAATTLVAGTDLWRTGPAIYVDPATANAGLIAAVVAGAAQIATGYFDIVMHNGTWRVTAPSSNITEVFGVASAPTIEAASSSTEVLGTLALGSYTYHAAMLDAVNAYGNSGAGSTVTNLNAAGGAARLIIRTPRPGRLVVWRRGDAANAAPDRSFIVGVSTNKVMLYDTGANVNKRPWNTTNVPPLPASTGSTSVDALLFMGKRATLT
jgi:hypothetical protein